MVVVPVAESASLEVLKRPQISGALQNLLPGDHGSEGEDEARSRRRFDTNVLQLENGVRERAGRLFTIADLLPPRRRDKLECFADTIHRYLAPFFKVRVQPLPYCRSREASSPTPQLTCRGVAGRPVRQKEPRDLPIEQRRESKRNSPIPIGQVRSRSS